MMVMMMRGRMSMTMLLATVVVWMKLACGIFRLAAARVLRRNLVAKVRVMTKKTKMPMTPCSQEYLPVKEEDEYEREKEGGAGGENLVGELLAHLMGVTE